MNAVETPLQSDTMLRYSLSSSQQKELLIRGQPLLIAVPMRKDCDSDEAATQLAREWLLLPDGVRVVSAQVQEIEVEAALKGADRRNLTEVLGTILGDRANRENAVVLTRHVVLLAIVRGPQERHPLKSPQWPGGRLDA